MLTPSFQSPFFALGLALALAACSDSGGPEASSGGASNVTSGGVGDTTTGPGTTTGTTGGTTMGSTVTSGATTGTSSTGSTTATTTTSTSASGAGGSTTTGTSSTTAGGMGSVGAGGMGTTVTGMGGASTGGGGTTSVGAGGTAGATSGEDIDMTGEDFSCIGDWDQVLGFRITNLLGHLDEALAVAQSPTGGVYPVGTLIQHLPTEAMVKRRTGFSPETRDWEFFLLQLGSDGTTTIADRGTTQIQTSMSQTCVSCHSMVPEQWDFVCNTWGDQGGGNCGFDFDQSFLDTQLATDTRCQ